MNFTRLNKLIKRIEFVSDYLIKNGSDPLLRESLDEYREELRNDFGSFLRERLFDIYDEYFEDDQISKIEEYIGYGVQVFGDEFEKDRMFLNLKSSPVRVEVHDYQDAYCCVLWKAMPV